MTRYSPREIETRVDDIEDAPPGLRDVHVSVEWRDAAPDVRPEGVEWAADEDRLRFDVWGAQRDALDAVESGEHDIVAFLAGYGAGKTVLGARWLLAKALEHPGSRFLAMGVDFQKARDTTYPKLFEQLPGERTSLVTAGFNGPENSPIVADYNQQRHRLTLVNDSVITLGSADKYSRYAGAEFGAVWLDEPSHYGPLLHDLTGMMTTRLRGVEGPKTQLWTLTGEGHNAAWRILEQREDADGEPIGLDVEVVRASVLDNPYLTEGDKDRFLRKYGGTSKEDAALHGGFAAAEGKVLKRDMLQFVDIEDVPEGDLSYHVGVDIGLEADAAKAEAMDRDYWAAALMAATADGQAYLLDVRRERGLTLNEGVGWLQAITAGLPTKRIYAEATAAQRWLIQAARDAGMNVHGVQSTRPKEERLAYLALPFERGDVKLVNRDVPEGREWDPRWTDFVAEWNSFGSRQGTHDDQLDAVEIALRNTNIGRSLGAMEAGYAYGSH